MTDKDNIKRKILTDRTFPNPEQIAQRKDFSSIKANHGLMQKMLMKKIWFWSLAAITVTSIVATLIFTAKPEKVVAHKTKQNLITGKVIAYVQPPLPGKQTPYSTYSISSKNGGTIKHTTGTTLKIPAKAFSKKSGRPISENVKVKYREFHNPADIFLSGIPMKYDSAGTQYTFESAGMLEILAFDEDEPLELSAEAAIEISMPSQYSGTKYNMYELDTINKNWVYKGKDVVKKQENKKVAPPSGLHDYVTAPTPAIDLMKPKMADPGKFRFNITYDKKEFPELVAYDNVLFEVTGTNFKPAYYKINWDKISLVSSSTKGEFFVHLKKVDTLISVSVVPVFDAQNYPAALAKFQKDQQRATEEDKIKEAEKNMKVKEVNKNLQSYNRGQISKAANEMAGMESNNPNQSSLALTDIPVVQRIFRIRTLGTHNCDNPMPPTPTQVMLSYLDRMDNGQKKSSYEQIYLVEKGKNTVFTFSRNEPLRYNPEAKNLMWTITNEKQIAFFNSEDFKKAVSNPQKEIIPQPAIGYDIALARIREFTVP